MPVTHQRQPDRAEKEQALPPMPPALTRLGQYILTAMFILGPLAVTQPGKLFYNSLDSPRRLLLMLGAGLLAALVLRAWSLRGRLVLRRHLLDGAVLLYFLLVVISSIGGMYPRISFFGPLWLQDSLPLLVIGVCLYFGVKEFVRTPEEREQFAMLFGLVGGVAALIGLFDYFITPHLGREYALNANFLGWRLSSTLGNPMFTGTYFAMTLPVAAGVAFATQRLDRRVLLAACAGLMLFALLLTQTRASWIGFALSVPFVLVLGILQLRKTHAAVSSVVVVIALAVLAGTVAVGMSNPQLRARLRSVVNMEDETIKTRRVYMESALNIFKAYPIQGAGYGNIKAVFPQFRPTSTVLESGLPLNRGYSTALPHNIILQTAAESGLMGLLPFLLLAVLIYLTGFRLLRGSPDQAWLGIGLLGGFTAYYITNLFSFDSAATLAQFWIMAGLLAGPGAADRVPPPRYGSLAAPLTGRVVSMLNIAALVIALGAGLSFLIQATGASVFQGTIDRIARAEGILAAAVNQQPQDMEGIRQGCALYDASIKAIGGTIATSLVPDHVMYEILFMAYRGRYAYSLSQEEEAKLRQKLYRTGDTALRIFERDPIVLRYYILQLKDSNSFDDRRRSLDLARSLVKYEPRSAEVHMLLAQSLQSLGQSLESLGYIGRALLAAEKAIALDDSSPDAHGLLAQLAFTYARKTTDPAQRGSYMALAVKEYDEVPKRNASLFDPDRVGLVVALLYTNQPERAVIEARKLQDPALLDMVCTETEALYQEKGQPEEGQRLAREMRAEAPAPAPVHGPMPGVISK
jgi:O-antigen ligase